VPPCEPVLWEPPCAAIKCPIHPTTTAPRRRGSVARGVVAPRGTAIPVPRRSKLEVANERARKLLAAAKKRDETC
jgi:hypothetical protein